MMLLHTTWFLWALVYYLGTISCSQVVQVESTVFSHMGESVLLPCSYSTQPGQGFTLEWRHAPVGTPDILAQRVVYYNGRAYWAGSWEGRATLLQTPPIEGSASIRILSVQPSDAGLYICEITNPDDWAGSGHGFINFTVLMPPSTPECALNGNSYAGNDITLTCKAYHGVPGPTYSWSREQNAVPLSPDNILEDQRTGSLILRNLSAPFSGVYTCMASNELGHSSCTVVLRVSYTSSAAVIGTAVLVTFIILLCGAVIAYFLWYKKRNRKVAQEDQELRTSEKSASDPHLTMSAEEQLLHGRAVQGQHGLGCPKPSILV